MTEYKQVSTHEDDSQLQMIDLGYHETAQPGAGILEQMYKDQPRIGLECRQVSWRIPGPCCCTTLPMWNTGVDEPPTILHQITMKAPAGSLTAVMGASGSGKTTLLDVLARKRTNESGSVIW